ncbi:hypothetical protein BH23ACT2_BH23ACT2_11000 [soil metagenome]
MFKTASKFLFALAGFGYLAAIAYAAATAPNPIGMDSLIGPLTLGWKGYVGDHVGYSVLIGLAVCALALGVFLSLLRDSDPDAQAQVVGLETTPEVPPPAMVNYWPVVAAFSLGAVALGLAIGPVMFVIGMVGLTIAGIEWTVRAWSDRATGDPEANRTIRNQMMYPVEIPALAVLVIAGLVLAVSRILLALPSLGAIILFGLVPAIILGLGALIVLRPRMSQSTIAGLLLVGGLTVFAGGVAAAIVGERDHGQDEDHGAEQEEGVAPLPRPSDPVNPVEPAT